MLPSKVIHAAWARDTKCINYDAVSGAVRPFSAAKRRASFLRRLLKRIANTRLRTKFLMILLLAMAFVGVSTFLTIRLPYAAYDDELYKSSVQMITLFADKIESELADIEALSFRILADNVLQENLSALKEKPFGTAAWVKAKSEVADRMSYFSIWFSSAVTLQLKTTGNQTFTQSFGGASTADELTPERIAYASGRNGREVWLAEKGEPTRLYLLREIREVKSFTLAPLATLLIQMDLQGIVEKSRVSMAQLGSPLSCAIYSDDICLYASDERIHALPEGAEDGYTDMRLDGQDVLCVRYTGANGWRYVTLVDYDEINATIRSAARVTMGVIVAAMALSLAVSAGLISTLLRHLKILLDKFDAFAVSGRPVLEEESPYRERRDEIGKLHQHFDQMTRDFDRVTRDNAEKQQILQEKQMQQLRAQLRPHFLYNTLESIYCLAQNAGDGRIATMTDALGKMLRASLSDKRDIVSVEEDLQFTREYLRIQLIRYGDRLRVEYDVGDEFLPCRIPAMTLQPLVENAVHHAAEEMLDACVIRIGVRAAQGGIDVAVEDNGPGIDEDILVKLESGEIKPEGLGIGMRNIHRRVQYAFGEAYGLRVKNERGRTCVVVHLPDTRGAGRRNFDE